MVEGFIEEQKKTLLQRLARYGRLSRETGSSEFTLYLNHKSANVIPHLREALTAIDEGTYGVCTDCDDPIPRERLEKIIGALRCVKCQKAYEHKRRAL